MLALVCAAFAAALPSSTSLRAEEPPTGRFIDWFGPVVIPKTAVTLDYPRGAHFRNGEVEVFGGTNGIASYDAQAAVQRGNQVVLFDSILRSQGDSPYIEGMISAVATLSDGRTIYVGWSSGSVGYHEGIWFGWEHPTYWFSPEEPIAPILIDSGMSNGWIFDVAETGMCVGGENGGWFAPYFGTPAQSHWQRVPGTDRDVGYSSMFVISRDGQYGSTGGHLWAADPISGFVLVDNSRFDYSRTNGQSPHWVGIETDDEGNYYFAGEWFNLDTFSQEVGFWNEAGDYLGSYGVVFIDFAVVDGEVIAAVDRRIEGGQMVDDGALIRMSDFATVTVEQLTGKPTEFYEWGGGLFAREGELGLLLLAAR
ncbi:MAG TPA: hypothetical protein VGN57_11800 [Pirellulaceae bacterium]|nr:hypothetical protein [Pirellulaceae bacterium]